MREPMVPLRDGADFARRVAITAGAVLVYHVGGTLPLPGLDAAFLANLARTGGGASERLSILALGIAPFFFALLIVELVKALVRTTGYWLDTASVDRAATGLAVALALVIAMFQASVIAGILDEMPNVVANPGALFRLSVVATLVAGAALMIWLADQITRHGLGSGVWIMFLFPALLSLPYRLIVIHDLSQTHGIGVAALAPMLLLALGAVIAITAWHLAFGRVLGLDRAFLWPAAWAFAALPVCLLGLSYLQSLAGEAQSRALAEAAHPQRLLLIGILLVVFSLISLGAALNLRSAHSRAAVTAAALVATVTLVAVALVGELLDTQMPVPMPISARDIVLLVVVVLSVISASLQPKPDL